MKPLHFAAAGLLVFSVILLGVKLTTGDRTEVTSEDPHLMEQRRSPAAPASSQRLGSRSTPRSDEVPAPLRELQLLWARGRSPDLLSALDRLTDLNDRERWEQVAPLLIEQASREGRPEVAAYLLATGDAAPSGIRLRIHAHALDNRDESIRDTARLELENATGEVFNTSAEALAWIDAHPQDDDTDEADESDDF